MRTILIVDDEPQVISSLKRNLVYAGFNVLSALNADEAFAAIENNEVEIVICDENMPGVSGSALLSLINKLHPAIVNILMTGNLNVDVISNALNRGHIFKLITKPVRRDFLMDCVQQAVTERELRKNICFPFMSKKKEAKELVESTENILPNFCRNTGSRKIMIADDSAIARSVLKKSILSILNAEILEFDDGRKCLEGINNFEPDIIFMDILMPHMNGIEVLKEIRNKNKEVIVIMVTAAKYNSELKLEALSAGANEFIQKPVDKNELEARVKTITELLNARDMITNRALLLQSQVELSTQIIREREFETLRLLAIAAEHSDETTGEHVMRVGTFSSIVAKRMGMNAEYCDQIYHSAPLHDIGKISVKDNILNKPGRLTDDEFRIMMAHSSIGYEMLKNANSPYIRLGAEIALNHHEKFDGSGYPNGLKSEAIPLSGRIVALVDVFDALTHSRPYKDAWPVEKALNLIRNERGIHFDPDVTDAFLQGIDEVLEHHDG